MSDAQPGGTAQPEGRYGYIALYRSQRAEIYASSLYAAKQEADAVFKPPKGKRHLITVHLAEKDGQPVTQVITT